MHIDQRNPKFGYIIGLIKGQQFRCSATNAKRSFNRSTNAIFGKVGRIASEEVTLQLVKSKCLPIWAWVLLSAQGWSSDFLVMRLFMKLFRTANKDIIDECRSMCNSTLPTEIIEIECNKFCKKFKFNKSMLRYFNISVFPLLSLSCYTL